VLPCVPSLNFTAHEFHTRAAPSWQMNVESLGRKKM
jgi:hypothetical protein